MKKVTVKVLEKRFGNIRKLLKLLLRDMQPDKTYEWSEFFQLPAFGFNKKQIPEWPGNNGKKDFRSKKWLSYRIDRPVVLKKLNDYLKSSTGEMIQELVADIKGVDKTNKVYRFRTTFSSREGSSRGKEGVILRIENEDNPSIDAMMEENDWYNDKLKRLCNRFDKNMKSYEDQLVVGKYKTTLGNIKNKIFNIKRLHDLQTNGLGEKLALVEFMLDSLERKDLNAS